MKPLPPSVPLQALAALARGNKIEAIRLMREATGLGLKESKDAIDAAEAAGLASTAPGEPACGLAPGEVPRPAGRDFGRWLLPLLAALIVGAYLWMR